MKANGLQAYRDTKIKTANQGRLIVMLYEEAVKQLDIAISGLDQSSSQKLDAIHNAIVKCQDIFTELMASLDFDKGGEIAKNLFNLYMFFNQQMVDANMNKDSATLKELRKMINELKDAWISVEKTAGNTGAINVTGVNIAG